MKLKSMAFGSRSFSSTYDVVRVATLNKTDLANGHNKFYVIESHVGKDVKGTQLYRLYSRYGRVGEVGREEERWPIQTSSALDEAFDSLLAEKTSSRKGYVEVKLAQTKVGSSEARVKILSDDVKRDNVVEATSSTQPKIDIHPMVARLVDRLYSEAGAAVRSQLAGTLNATRENPLGTLTLTQIKEGEKILAETQSLLQKEPSLVGSIDNRIIDLSSRFYSAVPQVMEKRPVSRKGKSAMDRWLRSMALNTGDVLDKKQELLELLSDVHGVVDGFATNDTVKRLAELGCEFVHLDHGDNARSRVCNSIYNSRGSGHGWKSTVLNVWHVNVGGQHAAHAEKMSRIGGMRQLFHGSRPCNIMGICKHGLLLRPPGVIITGSMFGNGLYFADSSSKSEQYSFGRYGGGVSSNTYFMFVADVALGRIKEYTSAQMSLTRPPNGYDSVMGKKGYSLVNDEYIIYDTGQHVLKFLVEFKTSNVW